MSLAGQITLLVERISAEIKALTSKLIVSYTLRPWTSTIVFRKGQFATYAGKLWTLIDTDGSTGAANAPPGPYRGFDAGGIYATGASVRAGTIDADAIHGACFTISSAQTYTHIGTSVVVGTITADTVLNVWVGLASDLPPDEGTPPHGTVLIPFGPSVSAHVKLTTPWVPPIDTPLIVWFGPTGSPYVNMIKSTLAGFGDQATESAVEYVTRPRGGIKTDQPGRFINVQLYVAGAAETTTRVWIEELTTSSSTTVVSDVHTETLSGTAVLFDPSIYRRIDFTTGVVSTNITLQNPVVLPASGKCLPLITILIRTPAATVPGVITWVNLTGGSFIPLPAASQVVAAQLEWVDETIGWLVVGVRA